MKNTLLDQLMGLRMNSIMNEVAKNDTEYQDIRHKSDVYSDQLEAL